MLPAVRRAVSTACAVHGSLPKTVAVVVGAAATAGAAGGQAHLSLPMHSIRQQRRFSSSSSSSSKPSSSSSAAKPPVPGSKSKSKAKSQEDGETSKTKAEAAKTKARSREAKSDAAPGKTRRKKEAAQAALPPSKTAKIPNVPSVPGTEHLSPEFANLASFFSMHRPISITQGLPKNVSEEAFAHIFAMSSRSSPDVISTLSATVESLEGPMAEMAIGGGEADHEPAGTMASATDILRNIQQHMSGGLGRAGAESSPSELRWPYHPPPVPSAESPAEAAASATTDEVGSVTEIDTAEQDPDVASVLDFGGTPGMRKFDAVFTVEDTTDLDGKVRTYIHSPRIPQLSEGLRRIRLALAMARMNARRQGVMHAISVKRQKKLKMKKKKYKKLQKRLKLEKRKQDRA